MRVIKAISDRNMVQHLYYLLEFLAAWEKRPEYLTEMTYEWCSAISEVAGKLGQGEIPIIEPRPPFNELASRLSTQDVCSLPHGFSLQFRLGQQGPVFYQSLGYRPPLVNLDFSNVGPGCDPFRLGDTSYRTLGDSLEGPTPIHYAQLLSITLEIGFRLESSRGMVFNSQEHTPDHDWMFGTAFSSRDDEIAADAICAYLANRYRTPLGSFVRHFSKCVGSNTPFSPRLRRVSIRAIEELWLVGRLVPALEAAPWLDRLSIGMDDVGEWKSEWGALLVDVVCSPTGSKSLSSHYWDLLDKLAPHVEPRRDFGPRGMEVMKSLEKAEDWWRLEVWVAVVWQAPLDGTMKEEVGRVTLKLLLQRPSALRRFEDLRQMRQWNEDTGGTVIEELQRILCEQARTEQSPSRSPPPYVYFRSTQHPSILIPPFPPLQSTDSGAATRPPPFCRRRHFLNSFIVLLWADFQRVGGSFVFLC